MVFAPPLNINRNQWNYSLSAVSASWLCDLFLNWNCETYTNPSSPSSSSLLKLFPSSSISCQTPAALTRQRRGTLPLMVFTPTDWGQSRGRSAVNCWLDAADGQPISRQCCSWEESEAKCEHLKHHRVSNRFKPNWKADLFFLFYFFLFYLLNIETFVSSDRTGSVLRGTCCHAFNAFLWFFMIFLGSNIEDWQVRFADERQQGHGDILFLK